MLQLALQGVAAALSAVLPAQAFGCTSHDVNTIWNDDGVEAALAGAWAASKPGTPDAHEEGGWIYDCLRGGDSRLEVHEWPPGTATKIPVGPLLDDPDCQLVGMFHTHPYPPSGDQPNRGPGTRLLSEAPSNADKDLADEFGVPGFIVYGHPGDPQHLAYGPDVPTSPCRGEGEGRDARSAGDPHLFTFDGYDYDFQAAGEFVLVRARRGDLEVQARQEPGAGGRVSYNTAFAFRIDGSVVHVDQAQVVVDARASPIYEFRQATTPGGGRIWNDGGVIHLEWSDGSEAIVVARGVDIRLAETRRGAVEGLLGDFDGSRRNDLAGEGGELLLADDRLTFDERYGSLAEAWAVTPRTSLFTYEDGQGPQTYRLPDVPGSALSLDDLDPDAVAEAEAQCRDEGVTDPAWLADCAFDLAATGDEAFAAEAAALARAAAGLGADVPPIVDAAGSQREDLVRTLIDEGADVDATDPDGRSALHLAVLGGNEEIAGMLLAAGARVDLADENGWTPLHHAAFWGLADLAELLIDAGADPTLENDAGETPADLAREQRRDDVLEVLE